jgi:hypothetical protein
MRQQKACAANIAAKLERGREFYERRAWADAYQSFSHIDKKEPLAADDLELLAMLASIVGHISERIAGRTESVLQAA